MQVKPKTLYGIIALLIAIVVILSGIAALYYYQYNEAESVNQAYVAQLRQLNVKYRSDILIDYGNGTRDWYNNTKVQPGWSLYVATEVITNGNINATYYPQYQSHFVTAIYKVANTDSKYWLLWTYNNSNSSWLQAQVGPDQLQMFNGSAYAWSYCGSNCTSP